MKFTEDTIRPLTDMVSGLGETVEGLATDRNTIRHKLDSTSKWRLPQLIRPIAFIWSMANETILTIVAITLAFMTEVDPNGLMAVQTALASNTIILTSIIAYYFKSRRQEKIAAKNASANLEMKILEFDMELAKEKMYLDKEEELIDIDIKSRAADSKIESRDKRWRFRKKKRNN